MHTWDTLCGSILHWQCRTILVKVRILHPLPAYILYIYIHIYIYIYIYIYITVALISCLKKALKMLKVKPSGEKETLFHITKMPQRKWCHSG